jgi:hypothetical protein
MLADKVLSCSICRPGKSSGEFPASGDGYLIKAIFRTWENGPAVRRQK